MSYPFEQFTTGESYSTPPTPIDGYPQWETVEREQEQHQLQQHQQHQQQHQQSQEQPEHSPTQPTPAYQLIHLEDAHSQHLDSHQPSTPLESGTVDNTPIHLHHVPLDHRSTEGRLESTRNNIFGMFGFIDHAASSSSASGAAKTSEAAPPPQIATGPGSGGMAVRSARSTRQYHQSLHPYQRSQTTTPGAGPSSVTAAAGPSRSVPMSMREAQVSGPGPLRFVHHNLAPVVPQLPVTTSVVPSAMPSPASAPGRMVAGFGSATSSPVVQLQKSALMHASPQIPDNPPSSMQQSAHKTYSARTDTHYDPERGVLTAILELPGVEKKDMKLSLLTLRHNRVRQLKVWGTLTPTLPLPSAEGMKQYPGAYLRERKFGEFSRTFTVPSDLKREDVQAVMKRGILILKIHLGPPAEAQDVQEITVS